MYKGYKKVSFSDEELASFYENKNEFCKDLCENEYFLIEQKGEVVDFYKKEKNELIPLIYSTIDNKYSGTIKPRNFEQRCAIDLLNSNTSKVKILRGVYGSGKDHLMFNSALSRLEKGTISKIIFVRPHVTVGGLPEIGHLPGDVESKLSWTLAPLWDKAGGEDQINYLIYTGQLEMAPLNFIRGRSFENSIVYMTEGQNMTGEIAKLLLGRIGEGSELWINADNHQVDRRLYEKDNGVNKMIDKLSGNKLFGYVYLSKTERSEVARLCELLDEEVS